MNHLGDIAKMMLRVRIRLRVDRVVIAGVGKIGRASCRERVLRLV